MDRSERLAYCHFGSLSEFGRDCQRLGMQSSHWGFDLAKASDKCINGGDTKLVSEAEKLVREFEAEIDIEKLMPSWELEVAGAFPLVPAFVAGEPDNMFQLVEVASNKAPLTIWVCVTSSAGISDKELFNRGMAITALFMALSSVRAVSLNIFSGLSSGYYGNSKANNVVSVALDNPVVLGEAAWSQSQQEFARGLTYSWLEHEFHAGGGWPADIGHGSWTERGKQWRKLLGITNPDDIVFPHMFLGDPDLKQPIGFCKKILEGFMASRD
jgi:hypothetical protein